MIFRRVFVYFGAIFFRRHFHYLCVILISILIMACAPKNHENRSISVKIIRLIRFFTYSYGRQRPLIIPCACTCACVHWILVGNYETACSLLLS